MAADEEIFVLSLTLEDGSPYVTSASSRGDVRQVATRLGGLKPRATTTVSHWRRDVLLAARSPYIHPLFGWNLQERYDL